MWIEKTLQYKNMFQRRIVSWLFAVSIFGVGYVLTNSYDFKLCYSNLETNTFDVPCHAFYEAIGNPLYYGAEALAVVFLVLLFTSRAFSAWKKFAVWFIPLAALLFIFYPEPGSGDLFSPYPEQVFQWVSGLYILVSITIIVIASLRKPEHPMS